MDDEIVNWIIDLQGGPYDLNDCAKLFESGTEIRVEREQAVNSIPRYYLHSSEFQGLPDTQIHAVATKLIAKLNEAVKLQGGAGSLMMGIPVTIRADGSRIPMKVVTAVSSMPNESLANVVASATIPIEFTVVTFAELPEALRENKSPIFVKLPPWLPAFVFTAVLFVISRSDGSVNSYVIAALSSFWGLGFLGLMRHYNITYCSKISCGRNGSFKLPQAHKARRWEPRRATPIGRRPSTVLWSIFWSLVTPLPGQRILDF